MRCSPWWCLGCVGSNWRTDGQASTRLAREALVAHAAEHDLDRLDRELPPVARGHAEVGDVEQHVAHGAAPRAHEVLVRVLDVGIDPDAAGADVEQLDLAHGLEVVDGLVHGLARDGRHLGPGRLVERLHRGVRVDAVQQPEDRLPLRRDPQALGPGSGR